HRPPRVRRSTKTVDGVPPVGAVAAALGLTSTTDSKLTHLGQCPLRPDSRAAAIALPRSA
ncbi:MAG TPA: hypothetical protein VKB88_38240, partial [Bryobacteraceae bacterium]|nr:hypothetical protein [Bryobacteraceae bacterium]